MTTRRRVLVAGGIGLLVTPWLSHGQTKSKIPRIGVLWFGAMDTSGATQNRALFRQRLAALGYVEGKNIVIEERSAEGHAERLGTIAREFVGSRSRCWCALTR